MQGRRPRFSPEPDLSLIPELQPCLMGKIQRSLPVSDLLTFPGEIPAQATRQQEYQDPGAQPDIAATLDLSILKKSNLGPER